MSDRNATWNVTGIIPPRDGKPLLLDPMPRQDLRVPPNRHDAPLTPAEAMARCPEVAALVQNMQAFAAASKRDGDPPDELDLLLAPFTKGSDG